MNNLNNKHLSQSEEQSEENSSIKTAKNQKKKTKKAVRVIVIVLLIAVLGVAFYIIFGRNVVLKQHFLHNSVYYGCSRPILGIAGKNGGAIGPSGKPMWIEDDFRPLSQAAFEKYCRGGWVIEYHAVIDILQKPDVAQVIEKYDSTEAWVKALHNKLIHNDKYLNRILPKYRDLAIHCIIVVHSPEETRFFLEHPHEKYIEIPADEFLQSLYMARNKDITKFWLNLR